MHDQAMVVYVTGAVKRPGLYQLRAGDRYAAAVELAGGLEAAADSAGVNLAQRASDGDEIDVPAAGASARLFDARVAPAANHHRSRRRSATPPPDASVDVNAAGEAELAAVPGNRARRRRPDRRAARSARVTSPRSTSCSTSPE